MRLGLALVIQLGLELLDEAGVLESALRDYGDRGG
jgi:hypothetical protein